jgi:hypothetical protein
VPIGRKEVRDLFEGLEVLSLILYIRLKGRDHFVAYKVSCIYKSKHSTLYSPFGKSQFRLKNLQTFSWRET